jgi:hypothetical protein
MPLPKAAIDLLPEAKRQQIVEALLQGKPVREVAKMVGISFVQVAAYKRKNLLPAMQTAINAVRQSGEDVRGAEGFCKAVDLTRTLTRASPFLERLEALWVTTNGAIERAKSAVRVVRDEDTGELVAVGPDVSAIAPLLNQGHKNLEILGKVTGELREAAAPQVAIQIVMPSLPAPGPATEPERQAITIALPKR